MLKCLSRGTVGLQINNIFTNIRHDVIDHYYSLFQDFSYLPSVLWRWLGDRKGIPPVTSCVGGRHNMPPPARDLDLLTLKVVSESRVTWATSLPTIVLLGLSVLDLGPMYVTDFRQHHHLMPPRQGHNKLYDGLLVVTIWLELCSHNWWWQLPVVTTISTILSSSKIQNGDILVPAYRSWRGKQASDECRDFPTSREFFGLF